MGEFQFRNNEHINFGRWVLILKVKGDGFLNVSIQLVDSLPLSENVLTNSTSTPGFAVVVHFDSDQHTDILAPRPPYSNDFNSWVVD